MGSHSARPAHRQGRDQVGWIESGTKQYTVQSLLKLCKALGLRLAFPAKGSKAAFAKGAIGTDDVMCR